MAEFVVALALLVLVGWVVMSSLQNASQQAAQDQMLTLANLQARTVMEGLTEQARTRGVSALASVPQTATSDPTLCYTVDVTSLSASLSRVDVSVYRATLSGKIDAGKPGGGLLIKLTSWQSRL